MTPYQQEQVEVLRRIAERGLAYAQRDMRELEERFLNRYIDLWQHMLDEIERLKNGR